MKRILTIVRAHGARTLLARASAYAGALLANVRRAAAARLTEKWAMRLPQRNALEFTDPSYPAVTVLVAAKSDARYVNRCLRALRNLGSEARLQIIAACDTAITDKLREHRGVGVLAKPAGEPFSRVLEKAARQARARYLYVIDSRAVVTGETISRLESTLDGDRTVALASSMICSVSGSLCEAGRTVGADGKIRAEGAGCSESDSRFAFVRDVASVSPASFMARIEPLRTALSSEGPFRSPVYATAHLSYALRELGMRCLYQPQSRVLSDGPEDAYYPDEPQLFKKMWLQDGRPSGIDARGRLLVLDEHVPFENRDAGSRRLGSLLRLARDSGWIVMFGSLDRRAYQPYVHDLTQAGIELILGFDPKTLAALTARGLHLDCVWLCRPQVASAYIDAVRSLQPHATIVYDTVDLHHVRLERQAGVEASAIDWKTMERRELQAAHRSDTVVVTSLAEMDLLKAKGVSSVAVLGLAEPSREHVPGPLGRSGVLFFGNYAHAPNVDAARWLAAEIMPRVWKRIPGVPLTLAGADPTPALKRLASPLVRVPGFVDDLEPELGSHRVFAAPLRYGAGLKGKILQAMAAGVPIVTTTVGAEGILENADEMMVADDADAFAVAVIELYSDDEKWLAHSAAAHRGALRFSPERQGEQLRAVLDRAI